MTPSWHKETERMETASTSAMKQETNTEEVDFFFLGLFFQIMVHVYTESRGKCRLVVGHRINVQLVLDFFFFFLICEWREVCGCWERVNRAINDACNFCPWSTHSWSLILGLIDLWCLMCINNVDCRSYHYSKQVLGTWWQFTDKVMVKWLPHTVYMGNADNN